MPDRKTLDVYKTYRHNDPSPADATELNRYVMPDGSRVAAAPGATEAEVKRARKKLIVKSEQLCTTYLRSAMWPQLISYV